MAPAPPSFRVYTSEQLKDAPLRAAHRREALHQLTVRTTSTFLYWLAGGMAIGVAVLAALIGLTADGAPIRSARVMAATTAPAAVAEPASSAADEGTAFELPETPQRPAMKKRKTKPGLVRSAPY